MLSPTRGEQHATALVRMNAPRRDIPRNRGPAEFLREVRELKDGGYSAQQIADEANCCKSYVESMFFLLCHGCPSLLAKIEHENFPHTIAIHIARAKNPDLQMVLACGYNAGTVNMAQIVAIRQRIDDYERATSPRTRENDADAIIRIFSKETAARKLLIQKARLIKLRLAAIDEGFRQLFADPRFVDLLHAEGVFTAPGWLTQRIEGSIEQCSIALSPLSAEELLDGKPITRLARNVLRRMNPTQRAEAAEFMASIGNFSRCFALALLYATKAEDRDMRRVKSIRGLSEDRIAGMQGEWQSLLRDRKSTEGYGRDVLRLVAGSRYVSRLLEGDVIDSYLCQNYPDIMQKFRAIIDITSLEPVG
jgi:hypothetical protein